MSKVFFVNTDRLVSAQTHRPAKPLSMPISLLLSFLYCRNSKKRTQDNNTEKPYVPGAHSFIYL